MNFLLSTRIVVFVALVLSIIVALQGPELLFGTGEGFKNTMIALLCFSAVTIAFSAFASFDIETKRAFVLDIVVDVIFVCGTVANLAYLLTLNMLAPLSDKVALEAVVLGFTAWALCMLDFLISLNGGAGKLLEMDREHISRE